MKACNKPVLIIGHKGKTGSRVASYLANQGVLTRCVSRSSSMKFDWQDQDTWPSVLNGVKSAYITYQPDLAVPRAAQDLKDLVTLAKKQGLEHMVLLSGRGEDGAQQAEQILINSGLEWNVVRASWFAQNFSESFMAQGIQNGELVLPASTMREPFIDVEDIAQVVVKALTDTSLRNRLFEVTGPELLTFSECVELIAEHLGKSITFTSVNINEYLILLNEQHIPNDFQWLLRELFTEVFDGRNAHVCDGVQQALGRRATPFIEYVTRTVKAGHWQ